RHHTVVHLDLDVLRVDRGERNAVPHVVEDPLVRPAIPRRQIATHCRCRALVLVLQRRRHLLPASADGAADLRRSSAHPAAEPRPPLLERVADPAGARADARAQPAEDAAAPGVLARAHLATRLVAITLVAKPLVRVTPIRIAKALVRAEVVPVTVFAPLLPVVDRHLCLLRAENADPLVRPRRSHLRVIWCGASPQKYVADARRQERAGQGQARPAHGRAAGPPRARALSCSSPPTEERPRDCPGSPKARGPRLWRTYGECPIR